MFSKDPETEESWAWHLVNTRQTDLGELVYTTELSQPPNGANIYFYLIAENETTGEEDNSIKRVKSTR